MSRRASAAAGASPRTAGGSSDPSWSTWRATIRQRSVLSWSTARSRRERRLLRTTWLLRTTGGSDRGEQRERTRAVESGLGLAKRPDEDGKLGGLFGREERGLKAEGGGASPALPCWSGRAARLSVSVCRVRSRNHNLLVGRAPVESRECMFAGLPRLARIATILLTGWWQS
jgi:hypothetical protein